MTDEKKPMPAKLIHPRVHCLTNPVTMQAVANVLLAAGGSAIMAQDPEEVCEIVRICQAVLLNTGVPDREKIHACILAGEQANELGIPVVLDPVGAGASRFRLEGLKRLTERVRPTLIRCNQEEAKALLHSFAGNSGGVESGADLSRSEQKALAEALAKEYRCAVLVTGREDAVSDGERTEFLGGGDDRIARITGGGCMLSALCGLLCGVGRNIFTDFEAALAAGRLWRESAALAGRRADSQALFRYREEKGQAVAPERGLWSQRGGIGSFQTQLFDAVEECFAGFLWSDRETESGREKS